jgi:hypothetical protein
MEERGEARTLEAGEALAAEAQLVEVPVGRAITVERRAMFLRELMRSPVVGRAARCAGVALGALYHLRGADARFALAWDEAMSVAVDDIEQVAIDRALDKSDKLMEMVLKAKRGDEYRDRVDVAVVAVGEIIVDLVPMSAK